MIKIILIAIVVVVVIINIIIYAYIILFVGFRRCWGGRSSGPTALNCYPILIITVDRQF